jgi:outer membrane autotransporter protein
VAISGSLHSVNRIVQARQEGQHGRSSGDGFVGNKNAWVKPFGSVADQDDKSGVSGYKAKTSGIVFGVDTEVQNINRLGGALAITRASVDGNSVVAPQSSTVDSYQLMVYGSRSLSDVTDVNFQADVGNHNNEGTRSILFTGSRANSEYNSLSFHLGAGVAHTLKLNEKTSFTPSVRADYTRVRDSSYTETGAGALNLAVGTNTTEEFILSADAKLTHQLQERTLLTANLGAGYDTMNQQASITAAYAGAPSASFTTQGLKPSAWLVRGGLGVVHTAASGLELTARYDVESRESFINQTVSAKLRWSF